MSRGVHFTTTEKRALRTIMIRAHRRASGGRTPHTRVYLNPRKRRKSRRTRR